MNILAFDTSDHHCIAALQIGDQVATRHDVMRKGQAEHLMPMLEDLLNELNASWSDLDTIGVGIGPGNFTGVRLAVSAARGLALGLKCPAIGLSTLEAQAVGLPEPVLSVIDAKRDRIYLQRFLSGFAQDEPQLCELTTLNLDTETVIVGTSDAASALAASAQCKHISPQYLPANALLECTKLKIKSQHGVSDNIRPTPLYLRAADAAPPKDAPPALLT